MQMSYHAFCTKVQNNGFCQQVEMLLFAVWNLRSLYYTETAFCLLMWNMYENSEIIPSILLLQIKQTTDGRNK